MTKNAQNDITRPESQFGTTINRMHVIGFLVVSLVIGGCTPRSASETPAPVACWNEICIDEEHFVQEYQLFGTYAPFRDEPEVRQFYARVMLERQIIAEIGRRAGLDTTKVVRETVRRRTEMASRRHLFEMMVQPGVAEPTDAEIYQAFRRSNARLFAQQIYAPTREIADSLHRLLKQGADFDRLAEASMVTAGAGPGTFGYMGWVSFDELDEAPEDTLFNTPRLAFSGPVESLRGWHIFRVLEEEETVFLDQTTFNNQRDRLRFKVYQRRFNEASARFIRQEIMQTSLAVDMRVLGEVYQYLLPSLPQQNRPEEIIRFNNELSLLEPMLDPSVPIAMVDGRPFTVGQFLYQLPDIPVEWVGANIRHALEIAIRDSILAARSVVVRPDTARNVRLVNRVADYTANYYATLQAGVDTLQLEPLVARYYELWKNAHFVSDQTTLYTAYAFRDSLTAVNAILAFTQNNDWQATLQALPAGTFTVQERSTSTLTDPAARVHRLPVNNPDSPATITGPFRTGNSWEIYKATDRLVRHRPLSEVSDEVLQQLRDRRIQVVHQEFLPAAYSPESVWLDTARLDAAIPYY